MHTKITNLLNPFAMTHAQITNANTEVGLITGSNNARSTTVQLRYNHTRRVTHPEEEVSQEPSPDCYKVHVIR